MSLGKHNKGFARQRTSHAWCCVFSFLSRIPICSWRKKNKAYVANVVIWRYVFVQLDRANVALVQDARLMVHSTRGWMAGESGGESSLQTSPLMRPLLYNDAECSISQWWHEFVITTV